MNRLSLRALEIHGDGDLARSLSVISSLNSLRELSLAMEVTKDGRTSLKSAPIKDDHYNFRNLHALNLTCDVYACHYDESNPNWNSTYLESFQRIYCPHLKLFVYFYEMYFFRVRLIFFLWCLDLLEKFSKSLQYLRINFSLFRIRRPTGHIWENRAQIDEKALRVSSELQNLKELNVEFDLSDYHPDYFYGPAALSGWKNGFHGGS